MSEPLFSRVRWREGYDMAEVDAFVERLTATVENRYSGPPVTADDIRNVSFTPVRLREGYSVDEVDDFLEQAAQSMRADPAAQPVDVPNDRVVDSVVNQPPASQPQWQAPLFTTVKYAEGYDMAQVDDFVDRVMATVNGLPVDRPVTPAEIRKVQFTPVRFREGYDVMQVDLFLEEAESRLSGK
ncbi:DivIVA domain-containing protein [Kribbella sp. NPDC056861]|uniref:DivIVA domain-containing protein n=1 Tax=Kribbella sp. NPDC056861 TaxID=3154857 RepID=UPI00341FEBA3